MSTRAGHLPSWHHGAMQSALRPFAVRRVKSLVPAPVWARARRLAPPVPRPEPTPAQARRARLLAMDLTELAQHFGTDKWGAHRYTPHYERHLGHLRDTEFSLLEIGIGGAARDREGGASLKTWRWFFPKAQIVGLDVFDKSFLDTPRITTHQGSQVDPEALRTIIDRHGAPLVVIDDGSHFSEHIRETFALLFPQLPDGAIYVIEDTQTSYWPLWGGSADRHDRNTSMALVKDLVDGLNYEEYVDEAYQPSYSDTHVVGVHCYHNLVFIEKGENREGTSKVSTLRRIAENGHDV